MATISGDIELMSVGEVALWIASRALTGTLCVKRRNSESLFVIRNGLVWQATSKDPREYLGQHLINFGYITEDQLQNAFDTQQETHVPLGRILVLVDAVKQEQLDRVLLFKTREGLLEALSWSEGTFRFVDEDRSDPDLDTAQPVNLLEVHSESLARASMWKEMRSAFPNDATRVVVVGSTQRLSGFDRRLVELMAAGRTVGEASLELHAMDFQTYARLYDLYNRGVLRPRPTTPMIAVAVAPVPELTRSVGTLTPAPVSMAPVPGMATASAAPALDTASFLPPVPSSSLPPFSALAPPSGTLPVVPGVLASSGFGGAAGSPARAQQAAGVNGFDAPDPTLPAILAPPLPDPSLERGAGGRSGSGPAQAPPQDRTLEAPAEAHHTHLAMRVALAGRDWAEAFLIAQRILERDPIDAEAIAAWRVANAQLVKHRAADENADLRVVPRLAMAREQVALAHLTSKERYVLSRIDGRRSLLQIAAVSPIQKSELVRIVNSFVSRGVLEIEA